jgi:hypothetical protein
VYLIKVIPENVSCALNKREKILKGQSKMNNPKKLATNGTQDENKNTTQYVLDSR